MTRALPWRSTGGGTWGRGQDGLDLRQRRTAGRLGPDLHARGERRDGRIVTETDVLRKICKVDAECARDIAEIVVSYP